MRTDDYREIPQTVRELFESEKSEIHFYTEDSLDNYWSMDRFLKMIEASEFISIHDGTQVILKHPDFKHELRLDAGGLGDFYSHKIKITIEDEQVQ